MFSQSFCERDRDRKISIALLETEILLMLRYSSECNSVKGDGRTWHVASKAICSVDMCDELFTETRTWLLENKLI